MRLIPQLRTVEDDKLEQVREARIRAARGHTKWTEIAESVLVRRGRWWVNADSDEVYSPYRGTVFETGSAAMVSGFNPLTFYVDASGDLVFLERNHRTWSELYARKLKRAAGAKAGS